MERPLCFVLMPFGKKPGPSGALIDFDAVYADLIRPAVEAARLEPLRADEEQVGGIIHKPMFERLILCEYAVADLTTANANVFYELGLRHAVKRASTVLIFAEGGGRLPFDVGPLRGLPYSLGANGKPSSAKGDVRALAARLRDARTLKPDSPVFQLVDGFPDIQRLKTDVFRERVAYSDKLKKRLALARKRKGEAAISALRAIHGSIGAIADTEAAVVIDLFLSYRSVKDWTAMVKLVGEMSPPLSATVMVREQLALALNRAGRGDEAEKVLLDLISERGTSSETAGILGRVYKDRWEAAQEAGDQTLADGLLAKSIDTYLKGFESDWRDAYPGVNAVTLMELREPPDPRRQELLPVVRYAVERRIAGGKPDYWDHATRLELAVLAEDQKAAHSALGDARANVRESFEPESTARNLRLIREARERRGEDARWVAQLEKELTGSASRTKPKTRRRRAT